MQAVISAEFFFFVMNVRWLCLSALWLAGKPARLGLESCSCPLLRWRKLWRSQHDDYRAQRRGELLAMSLRCYLLAFCFFFPSLSRLSLCLALCAQPLYFRGLFNLQHTLLDLDSRYSLSNATDLVLAGSSAGGLAAFLHADLVADTVPKATVIAVPDSGEHGRKKKTRRRRSGRMRRSCHSSSSFFPPHRFLPRRRLS